MNKIKDLIKSMLNKFNFLDKDQKLSLTNVTVALFVFITALRMLFGGSVLNISTFKWQIQVIDTAGTLPILFSLLNYHGKRVEINKAEATTNAST
jgi:hypothetical protein